MVVGTAAKVGGTKIAEKMAGSALKKYFANLMAQTGRAGRTATSEILRAGTDKFILCYPKALNPFLRSGDKI